MFTDFDINEKLTIITILQSFQDGSKRMITYNLPTKNLIGEVSNEYLPSGPRLCPNEKRLTFFGGNNALYIWETENNDVQTVFKNPHLNPGFCEWSSDGKQICFSAYSTNPKKRTPPAIYLTTLNTGETVQLTDSEGVDRFPQWSPSNQYIAFHRQLISEPNMPRKIMIVNTRTKLCSPIPHTMNTEHFIGRYCWSNDSTYLLIKEVATDGDVRIKAFHTSNLTLEWTFSHPNIVGCAFLPKDNRVLVVCKNELLIVSFPGGEIHQKYNLPNNLPIKETLRGPSISLSPISNTLFFLNEDSCIYTLNAEGSFELLFKSPKESLPVFTHKAYSVKSKDDCYIPVHSFVPENKKEMSILFVHGGPGEEVDDFNDPIILQLLKQGYEVVVPAYRGCAGYGEAHKNANFGEYGRADVWDLLAVSFDWKNKTQSKRPMAIMGYSYGGFLTFLALSSPKIPWDCGITLWGVTRIEHLGMHLPKAYPYNEEGRTKALGERNPLVQAKKIKTPLLILHGEKDTTSTNEEVQLIQRQIQSHGGACELVIYEDDTHGLPRHRSEMFEQIFRFLNND